MTMPKTTADSDFALFITTPCFPGYPSAHASASYARKWGSSSESGQRGLLARAGPPAPPGKGKFVVHQPEADHRRRRRRREYGGIYFRFDQEAGAKQGSKIGQYIYTDRLLSDDQQ